MAAWCPLAGYYILSKPQGNKTSSRLPSAGTSCGFVCHTEKQQSHVFNAILHLMQKGNVLVMLIAPPVELVSVNKKWGWGCICWLRPLTSGKSVALLQYLLCQAPFDLHVCLCWWSNQPVVCSSDIIGRRRPCGGRNNLSMNIFTKL